MENFRNAALAYGQSIKMFKTHRRYTNLKKHVPKETLEQFAALIKIDPDTYTFEITEELKSAYVGAVRAAEAYTKARAPAPPSNAAPAAPPPPGF